MRRFAVIAAAGTVAVALAACGSSGSSGSSNTSASSPAASATPTGSITVFAASSLTIPFTTIGKNFEAAHPGDKVTFNFGSSGTLSTQITSGAPADVFASASPKNMDAVVSAGDASGPQNFVSNTAEVVTPPNNPANVTSLADLAKASVKVAVCVPTAPCGAVAAKVFKNAGITVTPVTQQPDDKSVLTQIETGNVDAAIVYTSDVVTAGSKVHAIEIPASQNASTEYPIATLTNSSQSAVAQEFVQYVLSPAGMQVLTAAGFAQPS
ncbi:MAG TPA: molybdate ABC transporter substrate-binding protein [Streptosporangiaceae bacterium]|nr:molybdate ABC transporter substrate-binding protein [Streptosporangiaceae bacterium]